MRKWLARLSFSFLILAAVLAWEGRRAAQAGRSANVYYAAAIVLVGLGLAGIRERHRGA
jgi:hypothetical protein